MWGGNHASEGVGEEWRPTGERFVVNVVRLRSCPAPESSRSSACSRSNFIFYGFPEQSVFSEGSRSLCIAQGFSGCPTSHLYRFFILFHIPFCNM